MPLLAALFLLVQDKAAITKDVEKAIDEIRGGTNGGLFKIFGDDYVPSLEWETGLVPALMHGLKIDSHVVQFSIDRIWHKVTGFELIGIAGGTFETLQTAGQKKVLEWLEKWWEKHKGGSRVDWLLAALESPSLRLRRAGIERLSMLFNKSFGFEAEGEADARDKAVADWRAWWKGAKPLARWDAHQACYVVDDAKLDPAEQARIAAQVKAWIDDLAVADFDVREKATERLIEAGRIAADALKAALKSGDAEVRTRAQLVLDAQEAVAKRKDVAEMTAAILKSGAVADEIAKLAAKRDVLSAMVIVEVCVAMGPAAHGVPAAKRAAEDAAVAWAFARQVRRTSADVWQGAGAYWATDSTRALFSESAEKLVPYLKDASPRVRMAAATVVASRGTSHAAAVKAALGDTDQRVRVSAIQALGQSGDKAGSDLLLQHLTTEKVWDSRRWAAIAIGRLRDDTKLDALVVIATDAKEHLFVAGAATEAIGLTASPKGVASLKTVLAVRKADLTEKKDDYSRRYVLNYVCTSAMQIAFANPDDAGAWRFLEELAAADAVALREMTIQALAYGDPKTGPVARVHELLQAASKDPDEKVRQHAVVGLRRWKRE